MKVNKLMYIFVPFAICDGVSLFLTLTSLIRLNNSSGCSGKVLLTKLSKSEPLARLLSPWICFKNVENVNHNENSVCHISSNFHKSVSTHGSPDTVFLQLHVSIIYGTVNNSVCATLSVSL